MEICEYNLKWISKIQPQILVDKLFSLETPSEEDFKDDLDSSSNDETPNQQTRNQELIAFVFADMKTQIKNLEDSCVLNNLSIIEE